MQIYKVPNVNSLCRACLQLLVEDNVDLSTAKHDIFQTAGLPKKFVSCTLLNCKPIDGLPKYLCDNCYEKLNDFHQFQVMCIESAKRFGAIRQSAKIIMPCEDEKPEFDLETQSTVEITISEPDVLFQSDAFEIENANDLETQTEIEITVCEPGVMFHSGVDDSENKDGMEDKYELNDTKLEQVKMIGDMIRGGRSDNTKRKCDTIIRNKIKTHSEKKPTDKLRKRRSRCVVTSITDNSSSKNAEALKGNFESLKLDLEYQREKTDKQRNTDFKTVKINKKKALSELKPENYGSKRKKSSMLQCDVCPSQFVIEHRLIAHKRNHDGLVPYPCTRDGCDKGFRRWESLSEHLKEHEVRNQSFGCEEDGCEKVCRNQSSLDLHQRTFHKQYKYICETCGKGYRTMALLNDHSYSHKDNSELPYVCEQCNRHFTQKRSLKEHLLRHAGIKNFICPYCGVGKTTLNELKYHINYHTLERRWPCRLCTHVSNKAVNLNRHIRTVHERIKNYVCRYCERSFANCKTLRHHEMIHTGEKPHQCQECGKRFIQLIALRTHQKIHQRFRIATSM